MQTVTINGTKVEYKRTFKALRMFEVMSGKSSDKASDSITDATNLMYCIVKVQCERQKVAFAMDVEAFVDYLDSHPEALEGFGKAPEQVKEDGQKKSD